MRIELSDGAMFDLSDRRHGRSTRRFWSVRANAGRSPLQANFAPLSAGLAGLEPRSHSTNSRLQPCKRSARTCDRADAHGGSLRLVPETRSGSRARPGPLVANGEVGGDDRDAPTAVDARSAATPTAEIPIWRHWRESRLARCGGLEIHIFMAPPALRLGEAQTRFSPAAQYE